MNGESTEADVAELGQPRPADCCPAGSRRGGASGLGDGRRHAPRDHRARGIAIAARLRAGARGAERPPSAGPGCRGQRPRVPAARSRPSVSAPGTAPGAARETSTRTVQNVLFILGGLLLGTAAIVFTAVAWTTFGVQGRAAILGVVTLVALAAPVVALLRKLYATAETVAAIALLLVLLDGYAAWSVNLFDAQAMHGARYAGLVCLAVAAVGLGYRLLTNLVGPAFVALLAVQPVLPLLVAPEPLSAAGWSLVWSGVAALNLGVAWLTRAGPEARPAAAARGAAGDLSGDEPEPVRPVARGRRPSSPCSPTLFAETVADRAQAGGAIVAVATVFAASTALSRSVAARPVRRRGGGGRSLPSPSVASSPPPGPATRCCSRHSWPSPRPSPPWPRSACCRRRSGRDRRSARRWWPASSACSSGVVAVVSAVATIDALRSTVERHALAVTGPNPPLATWQLPFAVVAVAAALAVCLPRGWRPGVVATGAVLALVALPGSFALAWWAPAALSVAGATVAAAACCSDDTTSITRPAGVSALVLVLNAVATAGATAGPVRRGAGRWSRCSASSWPWRAAAGRERAGRAAPRRHPRMAVGLLAAPPAVGSALVAAEVPSWWAARGNGDRRRCAGARTGPAARISMVGAGLRWVPTDSGRRVRLADRGGVHRRRVGRHLRGGVVAAGGDRRRRAHHCGSP